ncbi:hypothetical protein Pmani_024394 [Petrolisthes manimaculis]|uniref:Uncharacterized protein n=1 Tax=Petrolisthes manimaculis TaxID=1843537 RepID=A0AAE1PA78_9EUCA|nr:hypothetical protein Pmani_024394 [Petrolisthes manimaculis]
MMEGEEREQEEGMVGKHEVKTMPTPPDGGWGWVVVFASFMIHVLAYCKEMLNSALLSSDVVVRKGEWVDG